MVFVTLQYIILSDYQTIFQPSELYVSALKLLHSFYFKAPTCVSTGQ